MNLYIASGIAVALKFFFFFLLELPEKKMKKRVKFISETLFEATEQIKNGSDQGKILSELVVQIQSKEASETILSSVPDTKIIDVFIEQLSKILILCIDTDMPCHKTLYALCNTCNKFSTAIEDSITAASRICMEVKITSLTPWILVAAMEPFMPEAGKNFLTSDSGIKLFILLFIYQLLMERILLSIPFNAAVPSGDTISFISTCGAVYSLLQSGMYMVDITKLLGINGFEKKQLGQNRNSGELPFFTITERKICADFQKKLERLTTQNIESGEKVLPMLEYLENSFEREIEGVQKRKLKKVTLLLLAPMVLTGLPPTLAVILLPLLEVISFHLTFMRCKYLNLLTISNHSLILNYQITLPEGGVNWI